MAAGYESDRESCSSDGFSVEARDLVNGGGGQDHNEVNTGSYMYEQLEAERDEMKDVEGEEVLATNKEPDSLGMNGQNGEKEEEKEEKEREVEKCPQSIGGGGGSVDCVVSGELPAQRIDMVDGVTDQQTLIKENKSEEEQLVKEGTSEKNRENGAEAGSDEEDGGYTFTLAIVSRRSRHRAGKLYMYIPHNTHHAIKFHTFCISVLSRPYAIFTCTILT